MPCVSLDSSLKTGFSTDLLYLTHKTHNLNKTDSPAYLKIDFNVDSFVNHPYYHSLPVCVAGTPVNRIPIMAKQTLDLYELFRLVVSKGGLVEVINKKLWREITKGLNLPSSITSAAFTLRTQWV
jgi:hypothetical protein